MSPIRPWNQAASHPPSISVVIPTFDRPILLQRALRSVLDQSLRPNEVIVVDNGYSPIAIEELPADVLLERIDSGVGVSVARNHGAWLAKGDLLAFLDDDDTWSPGYLENLVAHCQEVGAKVCVGELMRVRSGQSEPFKLFPSDVADQRSVFFSNPGFTGSNILVNRRLFASVDGFDPAMRGSQDRDLAARLLRRNDRISVCRSAVALLHEDAETRSEKRHLLGDTIFVRKHWSAMRPRELARAMWRILKLLRDSIRNR